MYRCLLRRLVLTTSLVAAIACTTSASGIELSPKVGPDLAVVDPLISDVLGKCCTDGICEMLTEAECEAQCGHFYPSGDCAIEPWELGCPMHITGACCVDAVCDPAITGPDACECAGGIWYPGENCETVECLAKCCTDGHCEMLTEAECEAQCGHFYPTGDCEISDPWEIGCPMYFAGACCVEGTCEPGIIGPNTCECAGGDWYPGEDCQNFKCP